MWLIAFVEVTKSAFIFIFTQLQTWYHLIIIEREAMISVTHLM